MAPPRVLIAGAGALGSALAVGLARAGARVTLADPAPIGANASGLAAGMLAPVGETLFDPDTDDLAGLRAARDLWPGFARDLGVGLDRSGAMAVGSEDDLSVWEARLKSSGVVTARLSPAEARTRASWLAEGLGGLFTDEDWRLDAAPALHAMRAAARRAGVRFAAAAVTGFQPGRATLAGGEALDADHLVIATGASRALIAIAPELGALALIKGHILRAPDLAMAGPTLRFDGGYICPSAEGAIVGATMEAGLDDMTIDPAIVRGMIERAARVCPALAAAAALTAAAGVRAATPDGRPLVGPSVTPSVWLAVGARRNGWLLAPTIARTLTRMIMVGAEV